MRIRYKLILALVMMSIAFTIAIHTYIMPSFISSERTEQLKSEQKFLDMLGHNVAPYIVTSDLAPLFTLLDKIMQDNPDYAYLEIRDSFGDILYPLEEDVAVNEKHVELENTINLGDESKGKIRLIFNVDARIKSKLEYINQIEVLILAIIVLFSIAGYAVLDKWINKPIEDLSEGLKKLTAGEYDIKLDVKSDDEIGRLAKTFETMRSGIQIREEALTKHNQVLDIIRKTQTGFIKSKDKDVIFSQLLDSILELTGSKYGMISELKESSSGFYLQAHAISNMYDPNEDGNPPVNRIRFDILDNLLGAVIKEKKTVISNDPESDPRSSAAPIGHIKVESYLGIPLFSDGTSIGMIGLANRDDGFEESLVDEVEPVINLCTNLIEAIKSEDKRKQAESELQESLNKLDSVVSSAADGIVVFNKEFLIEDANVATAEIFNLSKGNLKNWSLYKLLNLDDLELIREKMQLKAEVRTLARELEVSGIRQNEMFPAEISISRLDEHGDRFMAIIRDITDRKKIDRMKAEFVSTVSHELRTPLTAIRGSLGLLAGKAFGELNDQASHMINLASSNCDRLVRLVNDILDIEKIESGKMQFYFEHTDLTELIREAYDANKAYADNMKVQLQLQANGEIPSLEIDRDRIRQVLDNLISNAIKFTRPESEVGISMNMENELIRIEIMDHGAGIPEEFKPHVFKKFSQSDSSDTRKKGGTGLGLSISKAIIEAHNGRIGFDSVQDEGTTFYFELKSA